MKSGSGAPPPPPEQISADSHLKWNHLVICYILSSVRGNNNINISKVLNQVGTTETHIKLDTFWPLVSLCGVYSHSSRVSVKSESV